MATNYDFDGANALSGHDGQPSDDTASTLVALAQSPASDGQVTATPAEGAIDDAQPVDVGQGAPLQAQADTPATGTAAAGGTTVYAVDASNTVKLPANVSIENMKIEGNDLVLEQADGTQIVIKDGALHVPTFIIDGFEVPRVALLAAIQANGMDVAYGADGSISVTAANPNADSSGANLEVPAGGIGDGLGITALLLNTDLSFDRPDAKELFGLRQPEPEEPAAPALNLLPSIDISGNDAVVDEAALPAGTNPLSVGETRSGTFTIGAGDGIQALIIDGVNVTNGGTIVGLLGTLTLTGGPETGIYNWTFTLTHSTPSHANASSVGTTEGIFVEHSIVVVDANGDIIGRILRVGILDDGPSVTVAPVQGGESSPIFDVPSRSRRDRRNRTATTPASMSWRLATIPTTTTSPGALGQVTTGVPGGLETLFSVGGVFGADGPGSEAGVLSFTGIPAQGLATTLSATDGGLITLFLGANGEIIGKDAQGDPVFTIAIVEVGGVHQLQLTLFEAIDHGFDGNSLTRSGSWG